MSFIDTLKEDVAKFVAEARAVWTVLKADGEKIIAWVDKEVPGAQQAIAALVTEGEKDLGILAAVSAKGFSDSIAAHTATLETAFANLIGAAGIDLTAKQALSAADVATLGTIKQIGQSAVSVALTNVLAKLSPHP